MSGSNTPAPIAGQVLGLVSIIWLGNQIDVKPGSSLKLGGLVNKPVVYGRQVGPAKVMQASEVKCKGIVKTGLNVTGTFNKGVIGELQAQCDTGQTFVWDDAFIFEAMTITVGENSEIDVTWNASEPQEIS